jgi:hypothetical protein
MHKPFLNEILRLGGDPADEVWHWLATRGPHGEDFTWGQTREQPPGYVAVVHLAKITADMEAFIPDFSARAQEVVRTGMQSANPGLLRRCIQVAAVVGGKEELMHVTQLTHHEDPKVAGDARACAFYMKRALRD